MKPSQTLLLGLGAATAVSVGTLLLWPRPRSAAAPSFSLASGSRPAQARPSSPQDRAAQPAAEPPRPAFAPIHAQLRQLLEIQTGDDPAQDRLLQALLAGLTDENVGKILPTLSREELRTAFGTEALRRWLQQNPAEAAAWIATRFDASEPAAALVARQLLEDPARLNAYCDQLPEGTFKESVLLDAGLRVLAQDPAEAIALAGRLGPGPGQANLLQTMAYEWTGRDPDAALAWMMTVPDAALREGLVAMGAKAIAVTDPAMAADWLAAGVPSPELFKSTALALAETWAVRSPADAAAWVAQLAPGDARQAAIDVVLRHWLATDPAAANGWILSLPERDGILKALQLAQVEPPAASADP